MGVTSVDENSGDDTGWGRGQEQLWNEMVQAIAHNFKNAFVPVQTCAELLPSRYKDKSFRDFFMATVGENIERINKWIEQLLGFSHLGEVNGEYSFFPLHEVIEAGMEDANREYPQSQVDFKVEYGIEDTIKGNRKIMENAFAEIIRNAIEAVQDVAKPAVRVGSHIREKRIEVAIEDNGTGLTEGVADKLFHPFASTKLSGNLGLGLAYAYRAITAHGGTLLIEPGEKKGTRVRIVLPQARTYPEKSHAHTERAGEALSSRF